MRTEIITHYSNHKYKTCIEDHTDVINILKQVMIYYEINKNHNLMIRILVERGEISVTFHWWLLVDNMLRYITFTLTL